MDKNLETLVLIKYPIPELGAIWWETADSAFPSEIWASWLEKYRASSELKTLLADDITKEKNARIDQLYRQWLIEASCEYEKRNGQES